MPDPRLQPLSPTFCDALNYLLIDEGGYCNVPGDSGGPTKYGITQSDLSHYLGRQATIADVQSMTVATAGQIYWARYWTPMHLDQITDPKKATALLDIGAVCGIGTAAHLAQEACHIAHSTLVLDPPTILAINAMSRAGFIEAFEKIDEERFEAIAAAHEQDVKFLKGWLNRARRLLTLEL